MRKRLDGSACSTAERAYPAGPRFVADSSGLLATWDARMRMMLRTDPSEAFVALNESREVIGVVAALARGRLWVLSLLWDSRRLRL